MRILIYGHRGFIGSHIYKTLLSLATEGNRASLSEPNTILQENTILIGTARCDDYESVDTEILKLNPDRVISCIGRSAGKNIYSTSYIESNLDTNVRDNLYAQLVLLKCCLNHNIHFTNIGDGCVFYDENDTTVFTENDEPNLNCSAHAIIKSYSEKIIKLMSQDALHTQHALHLRIRYPVSGDFNPKCLISKLLTYDKVINKYTSISILDDIVPVIINLMKQKAVGIYNLVNPGKVNLLDLKLQYKSLIDHTLYVDECTAEEHNSIIGKRSHVILDPSKVVSISSVPELCSSIEHTFNRMLTYCQPIVQCLCCKSDNRMLLDLKYQPLANDFHEKHEISKIYPLKLMYCPNCFHCQLSHAVNPDILFREYKYVSGTSQTGLNFFKENAKFITNRVANATNNVLDIACNDGSQLNYFKALGWNTYGVDPATNLCPIAEKSGHKIICDFWNDTVAHKLPKMDVITAQNVFAHTRFVDEFLQNCKLVMHNNSSLFIQTSQRNMIINGEFDTTYHEHISFFNTKSMYTLTKRNGMQLKHIYENPIHGTSYIFEIGLSDSISDTSIDENISKEQSLGLYSCITYDKFNLNSKRAVKALKIEIEKYRVIDYKCVGFGAAAKGQTVICYGDIDLDYIIDENPLKIGRYSPKLNIPIVNLEHFRSDNTTKFLIVILAWNFAEEIKRKIKLLEKKGEIVVIEKYFPEVVMATI